VKWTEELSYEAVTPFVVNSAFCVRSNTFHILIYARRCSVLQEIEM